MFFFLFTITKTRLLIYKNIYPGATSPFVSSTKTIKNLVIGCHWFAGNIYGNIKTITPRGGSRVFINASADLCGKLAGGNIVVTSAATSGQVTDCF